MGRNLLWGSRVRSQSFNALTRVGRPFPRVWARAWTMTSTAVWADCRLNGSPRASATSWAAFGWFFSARYIWMLAALDSCSRRMFSGLNFSSPLPVFPGHEKTPAFRPRGSGGCWLFSAERGGEWCRSLAQVFHPGGNGRVQVDAVDDGCLLDELEQPSQLSVPERKIHVVIRIQ